MEQQFNMTKILVEDWNQEHLEKFIIELEKLRPDCYQTHASIHNVVYAGMVCRAAIKAGIVEYFNVNECKYTELIPVAKKIGNLHLKAMGNGEVKKKS